MTTLSSLIVDRFLMRVQDYKLDSIYNTSGSFVLNEYVEVWLLDAIDMFSPVCVEDLTYTSTSGSTEGYFTATLSSEAQNILSQIMVLHWLKREVQNALSMGLFVTDRDMKTFSSAQNLTAKKDFLIVKTEEIDKLIGDYAYRHNNWTQWEIQDFRPDSPYV